MITLRLAVKDILAHRWRSVIGVLLFILPLTTLLTLVIVFTSEASDNHPTFTEQTNSTLINTNLSPCTPSVYTTTSAPCDKIIDPTAQLSSLIKAPAHPLIGTKATWKAGKASGNLNIRLVDPSIEGAPSPGTILITETVADALQLSRGDTLTVTPHAYYSDVGSVYYSLNSPKKHPESRKPAGNTHNVGSTPNELSITPTDSPPLEDTATGKYSPATVDVHDKPVTVTVADIVGKQYTGDMIGAYMNGRDAPQSWQALTHLLITGHSPHWGVSWAVSSIPQQEIKDRLHNDPLFEVQPPTDFSFAPKAGVFTFGTLSAIYGMSDGTDFIYLVFYGLLALLLVVSIITPIFTVAARRQTRRLGLLATQGATSQQRAATLLWQGCLVGLIASIASMILAGVIGFPLANYIYGVTKPQYPLDFAVLLAILSIIVGTLSAVVPAISVARIDPVVALRGGRVRKQPRLAKWMLIGPAVVVVTFVILLYHQWTTNHSLEANDGYGQDMQQTLLVPFVGIGLIASGWFLVWVMVKLTNRIGVASRIASRDAWRNLSRTGPAVAAVVGATFCTTLFSITVAPGGFYLTGTGGRPDIAQLSASVTPVESSHNPHQMLAEKIGHTLHATNRTDIYTPRSDFPSSHYFVLPAAKNSVFPNHYNHEIPPITVIPAGGAFAVTEDKQQQDVINTALARNKVVATHRGIVSHGEVRIVESAIDGDILSALFDENGKPASELRLRDRGRTTDDGRFLTSRSVNAQQSRSIHVPVTVLESRNTNPTNPDTFVGVVMTPQTAAQLGLPLRWEKTSYQLHDRPGIFAQFTVNNLLKNHDSIWVSFEQVDMLSVTLTVVPLLVGWSISYGVIILILALSAAETRRNLALTSAVGGSPQLIRRFLAHEGFMVGLAGTVPGVACGVFFTLGSSWILNGNPASAIPWSDFAFRIALSTTLVGLILAPALSWLTGLLIGRHLQPDISHLRED